jgi:plasmid stabilization system protein ParE
MCRSTSDPAVNRVEVDYYHRDNAGLGSKFLQALEDATARVLAYPLAGSPAQHETRRVFLRDFPFALVYSADEQGITIYALAHHSCRPGYWRNRKADR